MIKLRVFFFDMQFFKLAIYVKHRSVSLNFLLKSIILILIKHTFSISGLSADGSFRQANRPHDQRPRERGFRQRRGSKLCLPFVSQPYRIVKNKKLSIKLRLPFVS
jgi:hypothetical protein